MPSGGALAGLGAAVSYGLLFVVIIVLVALLGWVVSQALVRRRGDAPPDEAPMPVIASGTSELAELAKRDLSLDPDQLAHEQRFGEAIELLLLRSLKRVGWDPDDGGGCQTARDVLHTLTQQDPRRSSLSNIVGLAEGVRFGGAEPTPDRYSNMRNAFAQLAQLPPASEVP